MPLADCIIIEQGPEQFAHFTFWPAGALIFIFAVGLGARTPKFVVWGV